MDAGIGREPARQPSKSGASRHSTACRNSRVLVNVNARFTLGMKMHL